MDTTQDGDSIVEASSLHHGECSYWEQSLYLILGVGLHGVLYFMGAESLAPAGVGLVSLVVAVLGFVRLRSTKGALAVVVRIVVGLLELRSLAVIAMGLLVLLAFAFGNWP